MTYALDILSTFGVAVMLHGVLRPSAQGWQQGAVGAAAHVYAALSLAWPVARIWTQQFAGSF
jgi:hypothetical protein